MTRDTLQHFELHVLLAMLLAAALFVKDLSDAARSSNSSAHVTSAIPIDAVSGAEHRRPLPNVTRSGSGALRITSGGEKSRAAAATCSIAVR